MPILSFTVNCPDAETAADIADDLLVRRLVACADILPPVESHYRWEDEIEYGEEIPLVLKTRPDLEAPVEAAIQQLHPYDTPQILRHAETANGDFKAWVIAQTTP
ncbi:MAG: divalent-cation tolerance protein CutA [Thalassovita sp.]|nr:divalent-cation tolerance protein CutA [Thalassovita sp.]